MTQMTKIELELPLYDYTTKKGEISFGIGLKLRGSKVSFFGKPRNIQQAFQPAFSVQLADAKRRRGCKARKEQGGYVLL